LKALLTKYTQRPFYSFLAIVAFLLPIIIYFYAVFKHTVNIPKWDDYGAILNFLTNASDANIFEKLKLITGFHNEHRIFFVRLSSWLEYTFFGTVNFQHLAIWGSLGLIGVLFIIYKFQSKIEGNLWYFLPVPFLLFQLQYLELSLWSMASIQIIFTLLFAFTSLYLLSKEQGTKYFIAAVFFALLAAFNSGNGIVVFVAGAPILFYRPNAGKLIWIWIGFMMLTLLLYFNFGSKGGMISQLPIILIEQPLLISNYFLLFLSSGLVKVFGNTFSQILTALFCLLLIYYVLKTTKGNKMNSQLVALSLFMIGTALIVAFRRGPELGVSQALSSRYKIHSLLFLISLYLLYLDYLKANTRKYYIAVISFLCIGFYIWLLPKNYQVMATHKAKLINGTIRYHLGFGSNTLNFKDVDRASSMLKTSEELDIYQLPDLDKLFYKSITQNIKLPPESKGIKSAFKLVDQSGRLYIYRGWAYIKETGSVGNKISVVLKGGDSTYIFDTFPVSTPDLTKRGEKYKLDHAGFNFSITMDQIKPGPYKVGMLITKGDSLAVLQYKKIIRITSNRELGLLTNKDLQDFNLNSSYYYLDKVEQINDEIIIRGWAFKTGRNSTGSLVKIRLYSDQDQFIFNATPQKRTEVTRAYNLHNANYHDSGFSLKIHSSSMPKGSYNIDLIIDNPEFKDTLRVKNKTLEIK